MSIATTSYSSGSITVSGLGNGTDFSTLITELVDAESYRKTELENEEELYDAKIEGFEYLDTQLTSLKSTLSKMDTVSEFMVKDVSSSDTSALSASADSDADVSTHSLVVGQLAQNDILTTSNGVASLTTMVTTGLASFSFTYAGTSYTVSGISSGTTLTGLVNLINANSSCSDRIRATTLYDGTSYHLEIYGLDEGAENQVEITSTSNVSFTASDFLNTQQAQSAEIKVDGYPPTSNSWITRDTNSVDDVIPGVTLTLKEADASKTINIGISTDTDAIKQNIETFVSSVNAIFYLIAELTAVSNTSTTSATGSIFTGDYAVNLMQSELQDVISDLGLGFNLYTENDDGTSSGDLYSSLSQIGITTDTDTSSSTYGLLVIDDDTLDGALENDADAVAELFSADYDGESTSEDFSYSSCISGVTEGGSYSVQIITSATGISAAYIDGEKAGVDGWKVTALSGDAKGLCIELDNHSADKTYTGTVGVKVGKTTELENVISSLTDTEDGPIEIIEENYKDVISDLGDKIDDETQRLTDMKTHLQEQYAKLDALLNTLSNEQSELTSAVDALTSSSS